MSNICIFPGTFNPIHAGHIGMAEFALKYYNFDKIIFIPSYIPPHKNIDKSLAVHRLNMVKLAVQENKKFEISDIEYNSEGKSYSLLTVKAIMEQYKIHDRLNFIIGTDAFLKIRTWYMVDELKMLVHFIVFQRGNDIVKKSDFLDFSYEIADKKKTDISSSEIRKTHSLSELRNVKDYIKEHDLYN